VRRETVSEPLWNGEEPAASFQATVVGFRINSSGDGSAKVTLDVPVCDFPRVLPLALRMGDHYGLVAFYAPIAKLEQL
jgi:hypothetical protein